jgi:hypothetical protein
MKSQKMIEAGKKAWATRRANAAAKLAAEAAPATAVKVLNRDNEMVELTELETKVMDAMVEGFKADWGRNIFELETDAFDDEYKDRKGITLISRTPALCRTTGLTERQLAGVFGSLEKKKLSQTVACYFWQKANADHPQKDQCKFWE